MGKGVRRLSLRDQLPDCTVLINKPAYSLRELAAEKRVLDIGCGAGHTREIVETVGGFWIGVEAFSGGGHNVIARAEELPVSDESVDVVLMNAVLEHVKDVERTFQEVTRVLKRGGKFIGYAAFMECFHEISYQHLSFKALEHLANKYNLNLRVVSGGGAFGIDYHLAVLLYPLPCRFVRRPIARCIRGTIALKAHLAALFLVIFRRRSVKEACAIAQEYYALECLRQSTGFGFLIEKI